MAEVHIKKTQKDFENFVSSFAEDAVTKCYRNGFIVHVYFRNGKNLLNAAETLVKCFQESDSNYVPNKSAAKSSIYELLDKIKRLKKNVDRSWHFIEDLLLRPVHVPIPKKRQLIPDISDIVPSGDIVEETPVQVPGTKKKKMVSSSSSFDFSTHIAHQQSDSLPQAPEKQLKTDCEKCSKIRKSNMKAIAEMKVKLRSSRKTLREMSKNYNIRVVNQNMKRKDATIDKLRRERKALNIENFNLKLEVIKLKSLTGQEHVAVPKRKKHKTPYNSAPISLGIETLRKEIQIKEEMIQELESDVDNLRCELMKLQEKISIKKITPGYPEAKLQAKSKKRTHIRTPEGIVLHSHEKEETSHHGWWEVEKFTDIPASVAIEIEKQTYITVLDNGALELWNHNDSGEGPTNPSDIFTAIRIDTSNVAFKSMNGKYWSLQTDGRVVSIADTVGTREQFEPVFQEGKMALIGHNNLFLSYNEDGDIVCESCTADPKMWFKLRSNTARMKDAV